MHIEFFSPLWGYENEDFEGYCRRLAAAGFDGMELNFSEDIAEAREQLACLKAHGLTYIAQHSGTRMADFEAHRTHYRASLERIASFNPPLLNVHTGRDFFTFEQNLELIGIAADIGARNDFPVIHETHRGRFSNLPSVTHRFMEAAPDLRFAVDFSHWCVATESLLEDHGKYVDAVIECSGNIHARIGFEEGPQVNDPRAPEWSDVLEIHMVWWDRIIAHHLAAGTKVLTITAEFGPPLYTQVLPYTQEPIADQWELNLYMMKLLQKRIGLNTTMRIR